MGLVPRKAAGMWGLRRRRAQLVQGNGDRRRFLGPDFVSGGHRGVSQLGGGKS